MQETEMKKGDIVKHRLNKMKMIIVDTNGSAPSPVICRWFNEKEDCWKTENFMLEELELFKAR